MFSVRLSWRFSPLPPLYFSRTILFVCFTQSGDRFSMIMKMVKKKTKHMGFFFWYRFFFLSQNSRSIPVPSRFRTFSQRFAGYRLCGSASPHCGLNELNKKRLLHGELTARTAETLICSLIDKQIRNMIGCFFLEGCVRGVHYHPPIFVIKGGY